MTSLLAPEFLARLERLELRVRRMHSGERQGDTLSARRGPGTSFRGHRGYVAGDDPRFIDWNAFLRLDELVIKEFDAEVQPKVTILIDVSASMTSSGGGKADAARKLAAALGWIVLARHGAVRVVPFPGSRSDTAFSGRAGATAYLAHLDKLDGAKEGDLLATAQSVFVARRHPGVTLILSDWWDTRCFETGMAWLRQRGEIVEALHLYLPTETEPALSGLVELVDSESGRRTRAELSPSLLAKYREIVESHFAEASRTARALGVGYHRLDASAETETLVLETLRARALVR